MSFELLRRQLKRLDEVAAAGTFDSVVESVEAAAAARAVTDEGQQIRGRAGKKKNQQQQTVEAKSQRKAVAQMHGGTISLNERVARKVAEARMMSDVKKNVQDNQRRFLHSRMSAENLQHVEAARNCASRKLMARKTDSTKGSRSSGSKAKRE
jgi:hypothetical protein